MSCCRSCGAELGDGAAFCPSCGRAVKIITEAHKLPGTPMVTWMTMQDDQVCDICRLRHGKRYRLDRVPEREPGCRCILVPDPEEI